MTLIGMLTSLARGEGRVSMFCTVMEVKITNNEPCQTLCYGGQSNAIARLMNFCPHVFFSFKYVIKKCSIYHKHGQEHFCYPPSKSCLDAATVITSNEVAGQTPSLSITSLLFCLFGLYLWGSHYSCVRGWGWSWSQRQQKAWSPLLYLFHASLSFLNTFLCHLHVWATECSIIGVILSVVL